MRRLAILDGMRGWFLCTMTISHIILNGDVMVKDMHFAHLMFVESAQGFIFLAGLLGGALLTSRMARGGMRDVLGWTAGRVTKLWIVSVSMILTAFLLREHLPDGPWVFRDWLGWSSTDEPARALAVGLLLFQPTFMDILPQYILYLAAAPFVVWLVLRGHWPLVAALSLCLWFSAQLGLWQPLGQLVDAGLTVRDRQGLRMAFQPAAWQIVFTSGLVIGTLWRAGRLDVDRFLPRDPAIAIGVAVMLAFFLPLRVLTAHGWLPDDVLNIFASMETRRTFGPVYVISFISAAWLLAWVLRHGGTTGHVWIDRPAGLLRALLGWRLAETMGRHSMLVYVWHVLLVYALRYIEGVAGPLSWVEVNVLAVKVMLLLPLPALLMDWFQTRQLVVAPGR